MITTLAMVTMTDMQVTMTNITNMISVTMTTTMAEATMTTGMKWPRFNYKVQSCSQKQNDILNIMLEPFKL